MHSVINIDHNELQNIANDFIIFERRFSPFQTTQNNFAIVIHRLNVEYITVVIVPGSLLRSTKECKLGYFMGVPFHSHSEFLTESFASRIDAVSARPLVKSA